MSMQVIFGVLALGISGGNESDHWPSPMSTSRKWDFSRIFRLVFSRDPADCQLLVDGSHDC